MRRPIAPDRLKVEPDLTVPGHPDIFAIGDTVTIDGPRRQSGARHRAGRQAAGRAMWPRSSRRGWPASTLPPFRYKHAGSLAHDRQAHGGDRFRLDQAARQIAWWIWGIAHIYFLIGLRNRLSVALSWLWIYARDQRSARLITQGTSKVTG